MRVGFDVPEGVWHGRVLVASDLLLSETPIWQSDLVREEVASSEGVSQTEMGPESTDTGGRSSIGFVTCDNFNVEVVVGVTTETFKAVSGDLVLVVALSDGRTVGIVTVQAFVGVLVDETNLHTVGEVADWFLVEACNLVLGSHRMSLVIEFGGRISGPGALTMTQSLLSSE